MELKKNDLTEEQFKALNGIHLRDIEMVVDDAKKFSEIFMNSFEKAKKLCGAPGETDKINKKYEFKDENREIEIKPKEVSLSGIPIIEYSEKRNGKKNIHGNIYEHDEIASAVIYSDDPCMPDAIANTTNDFTNVIYKDKAEDRNQTSRGDSDISSGSFSTTGWRYMRGSDVEYNFEGKAVRINVRVIDVNILDEFSISTFENVGNKEEEVEFVNRFIKKFSKQRSKSEDEAHSFKQTSDITENVTNREISKTETKTK